MPRRCIAELVAATSRIGAATVDVENALSKPLVDVEIDFSSVWPPRMALLKGFWACVRPPGGGCGGPATLVLGASVLSVLGWMIRACKDGPRDAYRPLKRCFRLHLACVRCEKSYTELPVLCMRVWLAHVVVRARLRRP